MNWDLNDNAPIYLQLLNKIKSKIISGEYSPGSKLLPIRDFAAEVSVNPNTIQKAMFVLEQEGIVNSKRTSGKFVTEDLELIGNMKSQFISNEVETFIKNMKEFGLTDEEIIEKVKYCLGEEN